MDGKTILQLDATTLSGIVSDGYVVVSKTGASYKMALDEFLNLYESKSAASGGTALSLVTTGEKYTWNGKQDSLTIDSTPTENSNNPVSSGGVYTALAPLIAIGKPLVWHGGADVATLNGTIEGLDNGWTFTLTDSGTLTAGSLAVEAGDEVAWTGSAWFKIGGDGKGIVYITTATTMNEVTAIVNSGKLPVMQVVAGQGYNYFYPSWTGSGLNFVHIGRDGVKIKMWDNQTASWTNEQGYDSALSSTSTNAVQNATLYTVIGNVETLLAAL